MELSIVIPTYNRAELLRRSLEHLTRQTGADEVNFEVIVVDDGSTDHTKEVVASFSKTIRNTKYIFRSRDESSSRAKARNLGIQASIGEMITFLDTGVLVASNFIAVLMDKLQSYDKNGVVVYHYVLGLYIDPETDDISFLNEVNADNLRGITKELMNIPEWIDRRAGLFDLVGDQLNRLSAPWSIGWTAAYTASKKLLDEVGGFDETFLGWGAEDTDLSYRLYNKDTVFVAEREAVALHVPHVGSSESSEDKDASNKRNELKLHRKSYKFDTELYLLYPGPYYNQVLNKYDNLMLQYIIPRYKSALFVHLNQKITGTVKSAVIGLDVVSMISSLQITDVFIQNRNIISYLQEQSPAKQFHYLLGLDTPFRNKEFDLIIVTDFYRMFSREIAAILIKELSRISHKLILIHTPDYKPALSQIDNGCWISLEESEMILESYVYERYSYDECKNVIIEIG